MPYVLKCRAGRYIVPVTVNLLGETMELSFPYNASMVREVKSMAGKKWDAKTKTWTVANNRRNLFALDILTNGSGIRVYNKPIENKYNPEWGFWEHQKSMYNFIMTRQRALVAAEMRTGKTRPTLKAIEESDAELIWWVAPKSALRGLRMELYKWKTGKYVELITYSSLKSTYGLPDFLVFDEIQKLKSPKSQRSEAALSLSDRMYAKHRGEEYVVGLTGTPAPRDPSDWWNLCEVIQPGFIMESDKYMFSRRLGDWEQREGAVGQMYWSLNEWKKDEVGKLYKRLKGLVSVYLKKDCLDLPAKTYEIREIECSAKILRVAEAITNNSSNVLVAINKLRQLSDGFQYVKEYNPKTNKEERVETKYLGSPKLEELSNDLAEWEDTGRVIIYAGFQGSVDQITKTCIKAGWTVLQVDGRGWEVYDHDHDHDHDHDRDFTPDFLLGQMDRSIVEKDGDLVGKLAFVAQADSAGTGLELSASSVVIYYSNSNVGDARMQSEDRAYSNNMDFNRGLTIIDYCFLPTDYVIRTSLLNKKNLQSLSLGDLKEAFK